MKNLVKRSGYILDLKNNIWRSPNYEGIGYSDGDEVETRIASIIEQASDITVLSTELRQHCTDWPSLYHLSSTRANLIRPFESILSGSVLEIGAGCGAVTRFLGECGANVLALEGSPRRAAIARSRTRDLENVTVLAERFDQFQSGRKFDVITLIGVLEYANLFTSGENPHLEMVRRVRSMLKSNGMLIIAIENQLGLKYFAGAPEDHLGQPMIGIEGRYRKDQPQTFGRKVLVDILKLAGFQAAEFFAPFPDYKLPVSILTENAFTDKNFDAAAFAWQSARRDPQLPAYCNFSLELAWPEIIENGLGMETANSFLVAASPGDQILNEKNILAYHYAAERKPEFCKEAVFTKMESGEIAVRYRRLAKPAKTKRKKNDDLIRFVLPESDRYVFGKPLSLEFLRIVTRDGWSFDQVARFIWRYLSMVETFTGTGSSRQPLASAHTKIPGEYFDQVPQNIIIRDDDSTIWIDKEWQMESSIEVGHLLFRSLLLLMSSVTRFGRHSSGAGLTRRQFVDGVFAAVGMEPSEDVYERYVALEAEIQQKVSGRAIENFLDWRKDELLPVSSLTHAVIERDGRITGLHEALAERDVRLDGLNQSLAERDGRIASLNQSISERDGEIVGLNRVVTERDLRLAQLDHSVMENRVEIAGLNQAVAERDVKIVQLTHSVNELNDKITVLNQAVAEHKTQISGLNKSLAARDEQITVLNQVVTERDSQIVDLNDAVRELDQTALQLNTALQEKARTLNDLAKSDSVVLNLRETVDSLVEDRDAQKTGYETLRRVVSERDNAILQLKNTVVERENNIDQLSSEINSVYESKSWRFTAPLRKLARIIPRSKQDKVLEITVTPPNTKIIKKLDRADVFPKHLKSSKFRILLVSYYCPTRAHAGGLRILDIYALIKAHCPDVQIDLLTHHKPSIDWSIDDAKSLFDNVYLSPSEQLTPSVLESIRGSELKYDVIDLQFHPVAHQIRAFRKIGSKIIFTPMESLARAFFLEWFSKRHKNNRHLSNITPSLRAACEEIGFIGKADEVVCVSQTDAEFLRLLTGSNGIKAIDTCISLFEFAHALAPDFTSPKAVDRRCRVLYIAYFGSDTNVVALRWYLDNVHPIVKNKVPDYVLTVIGRGDLSPFSEYRDTSIEFVGEVAELAPYIQESRVGIAPALTGSGLRGKINQYSIFGVPSVVSPIAFDGLEYKDGVNIFVSEKPTLFAERCCQLLTDLDLNDRMGQSARDLCLDSYTWQSKWESIREIYGLS